MPFIAKEDSWIRLPANAEKDDAPVRYAFPECEAFRKKARETLESYRHDSELAQRDVIGLRYDL